MSEQLDWLARNVHEWGKYCGKWIPEDVIGKLRFDGDLALIEPKVCAPFHVTRQQWIDRRAELQGKPSWADAPEWAEWLGQVESGMWEWYEGQEAPGVHPDADCWAHQERGQYSTKHGEVLGDWRSRWSADRLASA
jgi:hypothetical protein